MNEIKVPPQALDIERSVLASCLCYGNDDAVSLAVEILTPEMFYTTAHQAIFRAISAMHSRGGVIDLLTIDAEITEYVYNSGEVKEVLYELGTDIATSSQVDGYCKILIERYKQRQLIRIASSVLAQAYNEVDTTDILSDLDKHLHALMEQSKSGWRTKSMGDIALSVMEEIARGAEVRQHYLSTGFTSLDTLLVGLFPGELYCVAARPGMGKSAFAGHIVSNAAVYAQVPSLVFTMEMSRNAWLKRMLASEAMIMARNIRSGKLNSDEMYRINEVVSKMSQRHIFIDDTPGTRLSLQALSSIANRYKRRHGIKIIVIDYLQLMRVRETRHRYEAIGEISRGLKALAKDLEVVIIMLSQLNREPEKRTDKRPLLSDLRESGDIEQDCDVVMFIYRPGVYDKTKLHEPAEIIIAKSREGATGDTKLMFHGEYVKFEEIKTTDLSEEGF